MESGRLPNDLDLVGNMVSDICYRNAASYFGFPGMTSFAETVFGGAGAGDSRIFTRK
jgi:hypothetical protein